MKYRSILAILATAVCGGGTARAELKPVPRSVMVSIKNGASKVVIFELSKKFDQNALLALATRNVGVSAAVRPRVH